MLRRRNGVGYAISVLMLIAGCSSSSQNTQAAPSTPAPTGSQETPGSSGASATPPTTEPTTTAAADAGAATPGSTQGPAGGGTETASADAGAPMAPLPPMPTGLHGPAHPWARMNARDRGRYMNETVLPAMRALFQAYDGTRYANVTCATCHGANAQAVHFRMPNSLPHLHRWGTPAAQQAMAENGRMFHFMGERVVPVMAQLLGEQPFNMQTHQGFGCAECHGQPVD